MVNTHLAYPELTLDKFSGTDPDQDADTFFQLIERKMNFALTHAPADPDDLVSYNFRKKTLHFLPYLKDTQQTGTKKMSTTPPIAQPPVNSS